MTKVTLEESGYEIEITKEMINEMAQYGDTPSDWGTEVENCVWVSVDYAKGDPHWDIPEGYPEYLPLWEERI